MKKCIVSLFICTMLLSTGFFGGSSTAAAEDAKTVKFVSLNFLTGPAAPWGIPIDRALTLGVEEVNERGGFKVNGQTYKWEHIAYDTKYIPAEAVKAANKAIYNDNAKFMAIGGGACVQACIPLMKENQILSLNNAGGGKEVTNPDNPLVFRYNPAIEGMYASILPYLMTHEGVKTMASINPDDDTGRSGLEAAKAGAAGLDIQVVAEEFFERGSKEFTPLLTKVIAKKPDLIETSYSDPTSAALICKQARELGYKGAILLSWGPDPKQVSKIAGQHAENAYMVVTGVIEARTPKQKQIYEKFVAKWGAKEWNSLVWIHLELVPCLTKAIEETQSFDPSVLAQHLENMTWDTPVGNWSFGGSKLYGIRRQLVSHHTLYQFQGGKPAYLGIQEVPPGTLD